MTGAIIGLAMTMLRKNCAARPRLLVGLLGIFYCVFCSAQAPVNGSAAAALPSLSIDFGATGLIGEMNSAEHYGALQSRLGAYNAISTGDAQLDTVVVPVNAIVSLSNSGAWFAKIGAVYVTADGTHVNGDMPESTSRNGLLQVLHRPAAGTLLGLGVVPDRTDIVPPLSNAEINARSTGARFDLLQRLGASSGLSVKLLHLEGHSIFSRPLPNSQLLSQRTATTRTYAEVTLVTILDKTRFTFAPPGWSLRPVTHVLYQRDHGRTQQGVSSTKDFAQWLLTARLQKDVFRAGQIGPYFELGIEQELMNDSAMDNDDLLFYGKLGAAWLAGNWARLDVYFARRQAADDGFASNTANVLLSMSF